MPISPYFSKMVPSVLCIFWVNFTQNLTRVCFKHYQNLFPDIPDYPINKKTVREKKLPKAITVLKKGGGGPAQLSVGKTIVS